MDDTGMQWVLDAFRSAAQVSYSQTSIRGDSEGFSSGCRFSVVGFPVADIVDDEAMEPNVEVASPAAGLVGGCNLVQF